jgi:HD-GYP domain-containing protein (c-di-GMP phosphodiesterase class II)
LRHSVGAQAQDLYLDDIVDFARLLCQVIDYKSAFTATHSSGVAEAAVDLGRLLGFSDRECVMLRIAAFLHDLGKLAIPSEILEKPGRLTSDERNIMRTHVYFTYQVLEPIEALDGIVAWASLHQERLDGSGYPFGYGRESLPLGARIMAVADVFTALTEDRPYRKGMTKDEATALLQAMAQKGELEQLVVNMLLAHYDEFDQVRAEAQQNAVQKYQAFQEEVRAGIQEDIAAGN